MIFYTGRVTFYKRKDGNVAQVVPLWKKMLRLFLLLLVASAFTIHPIHLGLTEILYSPKTRSIQVMHKFFIDDLEAHIEQELKAQGKEVHLRMNTEKENPQTEAYLSAYFNAHFQVKANGKTLHGAFIGKEYEAGAVWIYVDYPTARPKQLYIVGNALIGYHEDQTNIINIEVNEKKGSLRFYKGHDREQINF